MLKSCICLLDKKLWAFQFSKLVIFKGDLPRGKWEGRGMSQRKNVTPSKKYCFNNRIRMTLKVVIIPLHLLLNVALHVDKEFWVENRHISANMRSKICIKGRSIISSKFVTIWVVTKGGGGSRQMVTKSDNRVMGGKKLVVGRWHTF